MRDLIGWRDRVVEHPSRYKEVVNTDGSVDHIKDPGEIIEAGTPINAANLNSMDQGAQEAALIGAEAIRSLRLTELAVIDEIGFFVTVNLTNSLTYPFNNSKKTITFPAELFRNSADYAVVPEIISSDGMVGDIEITDKLLNGFKVAYTGSAKSATIRLYIKGGRTSLNGMPEGITA